MSACTWWYFAISALNHHYSWVIGQFRRSKLRHALQAISLLENALRIKNSGEIRGLRKKSWMQEVICSSSDDPMGRLNLGSSGAQLSLQGQTETRQSDIYSLYYQSWDSDSSPRRTMAFSKMPFPRMDNSLRGTQLRVVTCPLSQHLRAEGSVSSSLCNPKISYIANISMDRIYWINVLIWLLLVKEWLLFSMGHVHSSFSQTTVE